MAFVITEACTDVRDQTCVEVCPVDCIHFEEGKDRILYIDPVECIDCGACVPVCPEDAIFDEPDVPEDQQRFIEINALWYQDPEGARAQVGGSPEPSTDAAQEAIATDSDTPEASSDDAETTSTSTTATAVQKEVSDSVITPNVVEAPTPHASAQDFRKAFGGLEFPTSRNAVISKARDKGGLDSEVQRILQRLPSGKYHSLEELEQMVRTIYVFSGVPEDSLPL